MQVTSAIKAGTFILGLLEFPVQEIQDSEDKPASAFQWRQGVKGTAWQEYLTHCGRNPRRLPAGGDLIKTRAGRGVSQVKGGEED